MVLIHHQHTSRCRMGHDPIVTVLAGLFQAADFSAAFCRVGGSSSPEAASPLSVERSSTCRRTPRRFKRQLFVSDRIFGHSALILHTRGLTCPAALPASSAPFSASPT